VESLDPEPSSMSTVASTTVGAASGAITPTRPLPADPLVGQPTDVARALDFSVDVLHSRYELYGWCEQKVSHLLAVSGVLLGASVVLISDADLRTRWTTIDYVLIAIVGIFLGTGLVISLFHAVPKMNSKLGNESNPRVTIAIDRYSMDDYYRMVVDLTPEQSLRFTTDQIKGMNRNIMRNQEAIRTASHATIVGLLALVALITRSLM
jgi:hypothetical protein